MPVKDSCARHFPFVQFIIYFKFICLSIYLHVWLCWVLVVVCRIFSCGMQGLVSWPWIKSGPPTLGAQSLSCWTPREVPSICSFKKSLHWPLAVVTLSSFHCTDEETKTQHSCAVVFDSCSATDRSPPASSVHGIPQARILEWVAIPFSRASFWLGSMFSKILDDLLHQIRVLKKEKEWESGNRIQISTHMQRKFLSILGRKFLRWLRSKDLEQLAVQ